jgi:hypothetical protein
LDLGVVDLLLLLEFFLGEGEADLPLLASVVFFTGDFFFGDDFSGAEVAVEVEGAEEVVSVDDDDDEEDEDNDSVGLFIK